MKQFDVLPQLNSIDHELLYPLLQALEKMSALLKAGEGLAPSIEQALQTTSEPRIDMVLAEMLRGWTEEQNILPPLEHHADIVPRAVYWLTAAGFAAGILEITWQRAVSILRLRLKKIEIPRSETKPMSDEEAALLETGVAPYPVWDWNDPLVISYQVRLLFEFGTLLGTGVKPAAALRAIADDSGDTLWKKFVASIADALEGGKPFSRFFATDPHNCIRPEWLPGIIKSEKAGELDTHLLQLAGDLQKKMMYR